MITKKSPSDGLPLSDEASSPSSGGTPDAGKFGSFDRETNCEHAGVLFSSSNDPMNAVRKKMSKRCVTGSFDSEGRMAKRACSMDAADMTRPKPQPKKKRFYIKPKWSNITIGIISVLSFVVVLLVIQNREIIHDNQALGEAYKHLDKVYSEIDPSAFFSQTTMQLKSLASIFDMGYIFDDPEERSIDKNEPSLIYRREGWKPKHPIYIFPGFTTNGLILWEGRKCAKSWFRRRIWGHYSMAQSVAGDKDCWMQHVSLDPKTGLDPEGIKVRPASGLTAIDIFLPIYHVWLPLIEGLGRFGYDSDNLVVGNNDWRLSPNGANTRDKSFLTYAKEIELLFEKTGEKVILVNHSHGDVHMRSFIRWVEKKQLDEDEARWENWLNTYVTSVFSVGAPMLGVPKAASALLSGEFRDTAEMAATTKMMSDVFVSTTARAKLWRTWSALRSMVPHKEGPSYIPALIITPKDPQAADQHMTLPEILDHLDELEGGSPGLLFDRYSESEDRIEFDYLRDPLTLDPSTQLDFFVYYGIGLETEQGFIVNEIEKIEAPTHHSINTSITNNCYLKDDYGRCVKVFKGIVMDPHGDGTVTHVSNSHVARHLWHDEPLTPDHHGVAVQAPVTAPRLNPNNQRVVVKELAQSKHKTDTSLQYVANAGNHVDALGNWTVLDDLINEASGRAATLKDTSHLKHSILVEALYLPPRVKEVKDQNITDEL